MDEELERLERAFRRDPSAPNGERLKAALLRAGRRDDLRARYELGFLCDQRWESMTRTGQPRVRRCEACARDVHLARTQTEFDLFAAAGHCVAVVPRELPLVLDRLVDRPGGGPTRAFGEPCVLEGALPEPDSYRPLAGAPIRRVEAPPRPDDAIDPALDARRQARLLLRALRARGLLEQPRVDAYWHEVDRLIRGGHPDAVRQVFVGRGLVDAARFDEAAAAHRAAQARAT